MTPNTKATAAAVVQTETLPDPGVPPRIRSPHRHPLSPCGHPPGSPSRIGEPHYLVLEYLRAIRADLSRIKATQDEHTLRFGRLEGAMAHLRRDFAHGEATSAEIDARVDRLDQRVQRVEQRLEIAE